MARQARSVAQHQRTEASRQGRPVTERTLTLLETIAALGQSASLKQLALTLDLPTATVFRLCRRLEDEGYLVRDAGSRRYTPGARLIRFGLNIARTSGPSAGRHAILQDLVDAIGETCNLTALVGTDVVYLDRVETRWPLRVHLEPGSRVPINATASGKLFLSTMSREVRERLQATLELPRYTPHTITDWREMRRETTRIARRGFSTDDEEYLVGLTAVAVPIRSRDGSVFAAVACHAPIARMPLKRLVEDVPKLQAAATKLALTFE